MINVLVVDDHELIRAGISRMLEDDGFIRVVGEAASGEEAITLARNLAPNVILMDMKMPGIGGLEATRRICGAFVGSKIVVLSGCTDTPFAQRVLDAGANGYVSKSSHVTEIISAIKKVQLGERYVSADIAQNLALNDSGDPFAELSSREMQIASMIIDCVKVQDISDALCLSPKTVNTYRYRIFEKLGIESDVELTLMAVKYGLLEVDAVG